MRALKTLLALTAVTGRARTGGIYQRGLSSLFRGSSTCWSTSWETKRSAGYNKPYRIAIFCWFLIFYIVGPFWAGSAVRWRAVRGAKSPSSAEPVRSREIGSSWDPVCGPLFFPSVLFKEFCSTCKYFYARCVQICRGFIASDFRVTSGFRNWCQWIHLSRAHAFPTRFFTNRYISRTTRRSVCCTINLLETYSLIVLHLLHWGPVL